MDRVDGVALLNAPPLSVLLDQQLIENESKTADGEKKKTSYIEQHLIAIACASTAENLTLYPIDISVHLDTPVAGKASAWFESPRRYRLSSHFKSSPFHAAPRRVHSSLAELKPLPADDDAMNGSDVGYPAKRKKISDDNGSATASPRMQELSAEVERFATLLSNEID